MCVCLFLCYCSNLYTKTKIVYPDSGFFFLHSSKLKQSTNKNSTKTRFPLPPSTGPALGRVLHSSFLWYKNWTKIGRKWVRTLLHRVPPTHILVTDSFNQIKPLTKFIVKQNILSSLSRSFNFSLASTFRSARLILFCSLVVFLFVRYWNYNKST